MDVSIKTWSDQFDSALDALDTESRNATAEIAAFEEFRRRSQGIMANSVTTAAASAEDKASRTPVVIDSTIGSPSADVRHRLRTAYRETVMETPTANEFEGTAPDHMAAEFGADVATAVFSDSGPPPTAHTILDDQIESSIDTRRRLLERGQRERAAIESFRDSLEMIHDELTTYRSVSPSLSFRGLVTYDDNLAKFAAECERLSDDRQEQLQKELPPGTGIGSSPITSTGAVNQNILCCQSLRQRHSGYERFERTSSVI